MSVFERFTDRTRRLVVLAQEEARALNHPYIGTEHLLLGLLHEREGVAAQVLEALGVSHEAVREQVVAIIGPSSAVAAGHIPFTPRAKKVLELALRESIQLGHRHVGTEHILLGLVAEGEGVAAQILRTFVDDLGEVRRKVVDSAPGEPGEPIEPTEPTIETVDVLDALTPEALDAVVAARREARRADLETVELGPMLVGLLSIPDGAAAKVLGPLIAVDRLRRTGTDRDPAGGPLPLSEQASRVVAMAAAPEGAAVGTGHLAAQVVADDLVAGLLREAGADVARVRYESRRLQGDGGLP
jgi:hypothetical protein